MSIHADRESSTEAGTDEQVEVETEESKEPLNKNLRRNPNHRYHFTRNIRLCVGSKPVGLPLKIHLDLLTRFNGKKVILP